MEVLQLIVNFIVLVLCVIAALIAFDAEIQYILDPEDREEMITKEGIIVFISATVLGLFELFLIITSIHNF